MPVDGKGKPTLRRLLFPWNVLTLATVKLDPQLLPPLVEVNACMLFPRKVTTTCPLGWTRGSAPEPKAPSADVLAAPQVRPPSVEVLIMISGVSHSW